MEPTVVYPESEFQSSVVNLVREILEQAGRKFLLVESFGLDIAVFVESPVGPYVRMLEVKAFGAQRMGGVGFGGPKGTGSQVNLLLCPDGALDLTEPIARWIYADATKPCGTVRYSLFSCRRAAKSAMGGAARGKQNNLRVSALRDCLVDWNTLCQQVRKFVVL